MKKILLILITILLIIPFSGCLKLDNMEDIDIYTTVYPFEYIIDSLYGEHSNVYSIYPDGIIVKNYQLTDKQIKDYSKANLFAFNGLNNEKDYVVSFFNYNKNIKIIDTTATMEIAYSDEELWLNPSNLLMIAENIKKGLEEYIDNGYLQKEINTNYQELKINISLLDAKIKVMVEEAKYNTILVSNNLFSYLNRYGLNVISLDPDTVTEKIYSDTQELIKNKKIKYIYVPKNEELDETLSTFIKDNKLQVIYFNILDNISTEERTNKKDYITIMYENIDLLKKELNK